MKQHRALAFLALGIISLVMGFATGRDLWFTLAYLLGLLLIVGFFLAWVNLRWTKIGRLTRTRRTQVGQPLEERITITNTSLIPKLWLELNDGSDMPGHQISRVVNGLLPKKRFAWRVVTRSQRRGRYRLGPLVIRTSDPFGLFPMERKIDATTNVVVFPLTVDILRFPLPSGVLSGGDALRRRSMQITANAAGVRDYAPGDSFSRIHWKSSARRNRLIVKEFELDPLADLWIVPDMSALARYENPEFETGVKQQVSGVYGGKGEVELPADTEEYTVTIAASLARFFLRQDRAVGMMANSSSAEFVQPDRGERQINRLLETLAVLRADGELDLSNSLLSQSSRFQRGTTLIVITASYDERWAITAREMERRGLRTVTILIDPASFGSEHSADILQNTLHLHGLTSYFVRADDNLTVVLSSGR